MKMYYHKGKDGKMTTEYEDGNSFNQWCCGFFDSMTEHDEPRYNVVGANGELLTNGGFRRCERIHPSIAKYLVENKEHISTHSYDLWEYGLIYDVMIALGCLPKIE